MYLTNVHLCFINTYEYIYVPAYTSLKLDIPYSLVYSNLFYVTYSTHVSYTLYGVRHVYAILRTSMRMQKQGELTAHISEALELGGEGANFRNSIDMLRKIFQKSKIS